ncbi:quinol dehydrogenase ferredoxin subunit NapH [Parendozoicomonas sp. Alg238-R29]|uniref:quinol dehydrogenase ferredoxin subunit NapH n=1 Tax=Parendozoicomonas sp. Alg238-R29 TaxID=2993446 RepID=UPI00248EF27B|nr:quinol dehydrogenase ferredoxin subunit NapH [Parendozoicomonas sp. Alg238-R29]
MKASQKAERTPGQETTETLGWWTAHKFLILRRLSQISVLGLFLLTPVVGIRVIDGNLSSSRLLNTVPMTDPLLALQTLAAFHPLELTAVLGALLVGGFYLLLGGRVFCSWVCPINPVTDLAGSFRRLFKIRSSYRLSRSARYWLLALVLVLPTVTGVLVWEFINPIALAYRGILFGMGTGWILILAIFLFDLIVSQRGWCGHLCPLGAFYGITGKISPVQMSAARRDKCNDCMDCYAVCPEPHILPPALKPSKNKSPVLKPLDCTRCGRCIDVCAQQVFEYQINMPGTVKDQPDTQRSLAK